MTSLLSTKHLLIGDACECVSDFDTWIDNPKTIMRRDNYLSVKIAIGPKLTVNSGYFKAWDTILTALDCVLKVLVEYR